MFQSHLTYGLLSWGHSAVTKRIFAIQRRVVRVLDNLGYREDCRNSFVRQNILTLPSLYIIESLKYVLSLENTHPSFNVNHGYNTRQSTDLRPPRLRLTKTRTATNFYCYKIYNALSPEIRDWPKIKILDHIRRYLRHSAFYSID